MANTGLIPPGIRDASTLAFGDSIDRLGLIPLDQLLVNLVDNVTAGALPHLAEQFHITGLEGWSLCTTDDERRSLIKQAIALHRKKGTPWAVKEGLRGVGFNGATLNERLPALLYDGSQVFSGYEEFGAGADWARFTINLDLGESRGVSAAETALIRAVVTEWKNERSHLDQIVFSATTSDTATIAEATATKAIDSQAEVLPWGRRYDGSLLYNSGRALAYDGADLFDGATPYSYSVGGDVLHDNAWESCGMRMAASQTDAQTAATLFDGSLGYGGANDYQGLTAAFYDSLMQVSVKRHYDYSGTKTYGSGKEYDGLLAYNGGSSFAALLEYKGIHTIQEAYA